MTLAPPSSAGAAWSADLSVRSSKAGRTRPLVVLGWPGPVVSIFVTTNVKGGTNSLGPEIGVGRVVASVGDPSLEMLLPFGRSDLQLFWSGRAAVVGIDAVGGPPHGDFTFEDRARELPCATQWG